MRTTKPTPCNYSLKALRSTIASPVQLGSQVTVQASKHSTGMYLLYLHLRRSGQLSDDDISPVSLGFEQEFGSVRSGPMTFPRRLRASGKRYQNPGTFFYYWTTSSNPRKVASRTTRGWRKMKRVLVVRRSDWPPTNAHYFSGNHSLCDIEGSRLR